MNKKIFNPADIAKLPKWRFGKSGKTILPLGGIRRAKRGVTHISRNNLSPLARFSPADNKLCKLRRRCRPAFTWLFGRYFRLSAQRVRNLWWRYRFPQSLSVRYRPSLGRTNSTPFSMAYRSNTPPSSGSILSLRFAV